MIQAFRKMGGGHACECVGMCVPVPTQAEARVAKAGSCQYLPASDVASTTLHSPSCFCEAQGTSLLEEPQCLEPVCHP